MREEDKEEGLDLISEDMKNASTQEIEDPEQDNSEDVSSPVNSEKNKEAIAAATREEGIKELQEEEIRRQLADSRAKQQNFEVELDQRLETYAEYKKRYEDLRVIIVGEFNVSPAEIKEQDELFKSFNDSLSDKSVTHKSKLRIICSAIDKLDAFYRSIL